MGLKLHTSNTNEIEGRVSVAALTNDPKFMEDIDGRAESSFNPRDVYFPDYDANQLREILQNRRDAFRPDALSDDVIPLVAAFAVQSHGDARKAIDLFRGAGELAGLTTLSCEWDRRTGRLGLILRKPFWGRGYSGERAAALMELAFDRLDLKLVTAGHNDGNEKSRRAIERYVEAHGGQYDGVLRNWVPMDDAVADLHRYTVTRDQYAATVDGER